MAINKYKKIATPIIKRVFPELLANQLVGVRPMSGPVGLAYALKFNADGTEKGLCFIYITCSQSSLKTTVSFKYQEEDKETTSTLVHYKFKNDSIYDIVDANKNLEIEDARELWDKLMEMGFELYE